MRFFRRQLWTLQLFLGLVWRPNPWVNGPGPFKNQTIRLSVREAWDIACIVHETWGHAHWKYAKHSP